MPTTKAEIETSRFFLGGVIAAVIAAVAGVVARGVANAILQKDTALHAGDLVVPRSLGSDTYQFLTVGQVLLVSFLAGLLATVVLYLFLMGVPRPTTMFNTLGVLVLIASLLPILAYPEAISTGQQLGIAAVQLVVGFTILGLLGGVTRSTVRMVRVPDQPAHPQQQGGYQQPPPQPGYGGPGQPGQPGSYPGQQPPPQQPYR